MSTTSSMQTSLVSGLLIHDVNVSSIYCALQNLLTVIQERFLKPLIGYDIRPCTETWMYWYHSNIDLTTFYLGFPPPPKKIINLPDPSLYEHPPPKFWRTWPPPPPLLWNVPLSKTTDTHFLKKQKILFWTIK